MLPPSPLAPFSPTQQLKAQLGVVANHVNGSLRHPSSRITDPGAVLSSSSPSSSSLINHSSSCNQPNGSDNGTGHGSNGDGGMSSSSFSSSSSSRGGSPRNANNRGRNGGFTNNGRSQDNGDGRGGDGDNGGDNCGNEGNGVYGWGPSYSSDDPSMVDTNNTTPVAPTLPEEVSFLKTFFPHSHCLYVDPTTISMRADLKDHPFQTTTALLPGGE